MKEELLQFIWQHQLFDKNNLYTTTGEKIEVLSAGQLNDDAGPDFINAKIIINKIVWAGNVEIHRESSQWLKHHHHEDKAYDNVILHVVLKNDVKIKRTNGETIPAFEMSLPRKFEDKYSELILNQEWIPCGKHIHGIDHFVVFFWLTSLAVERILDKSMPIEEALKKTSGNWEEVFYIFIARNFGLSTNNEAFEQLARSLPLKFLAKHKNNRFQLEALLFGQAGFLEEEIEDDNYYTDLKKEYRYLKHKLKLTPIEKHLWKFMRLRPMNFPTIRLAQFAQLVHQSSGLFSKLVTAQNRDNIHEYFDLSLPPYWNDHYKFGKTSPSKSKNFGMTARNNIIINTIVLFQFLYGKIHNQPLLRENALKLLEDLPPEENKIIEGWKKLGIIPANALHSQALLHLKKKYCDKRKCLQCKIGIKIITARNEEKGTI
jgi:hypothetical protein